MLPRRCSATLLLSCVLALSVGTPSAVSLSRQQQEAFELHHRAALRGMAAIEKANELRAAAAAKPSAPAEPAPKSSAAPAEPEPSSAAPAPAAAAPASDAVWRQFILDRLSEEITLQQKSAASALPAVSLTQTTLERLLKTGKAGDSAQTSTAWYKAAALKLRAAMDADRRAALARMRGGTRGQVAAAAAPVAATVDTEVPPLTGDELSYIREMLEEAKEGDLILPK